MPKTIPTHIAGAFKYPEGKLILSREKPGHPLILRREPMNFFDKNAIQVFVKDGDRDVLCGYVPRIVAADLKSKILLSASRGAKCDLLTVTFEDDENPAEPTGLPA